MEAAQDKPHTPRQKSVDLLGCFQSSKLQWCRNISAWTAPLFWTCQQNGTMRNKSSKGCIRSWGFSVAVVKGQKVSGVKGSILLTI